MADHHNARHRNKAESLDAALADGVAAPGSLPVRAAGALSELADQPPLIALSLGTAALGAVRRDPALFRAGARMLLAHAIATGAKTVVKRSVDRTRPDAASPAGKGKLKKGDSREHDESSFPSGHSAGAVAVARAAARDYPGIAPAAYAAAAAVSAIQVPRAKHYPGDVAAGVVLGLVAEPLASLLLARGEAWVRRVTGRKETAHG